MLSNPPAVDCAGGSTAGTKADDGRTGAKADALAATPPEAVFHFHPLNIPLKGFDDKETKEYLWKWGFEGHTYVKRFAYDEFFQLYQADIFLRDFFADPTVARELQVTDSNGTLVPLPTSASTPSYEKLETSVLSLAFFDRLQEAGIIRENGAISKCLDTYLPSGDLVCDELTKCLLDPSADDGIYANVFAESTERNELIFRIFRALVLGGYLCQYEDEINPYLNATKSLYKDLVSVQRRGATGTLEVISHAFNIIGLDGGAELFPCVNVRNFCLVTIEPVRRWVTVWYHAAPSYYQ